jgi:hypothetical protein
MTKACVLGMRVGEYEEDVPFPEWDDPDSHRLLAEMWTAMASGPAIDEQHHARWGPHAVDIKSAVAAESASRGYADPGDVDFDPNDLAPAGSIAVARPPRSNQMREWDDLDDDEEEFYDR